MMTVYDVMQLRAPTVGQQGKGSVYQRVDRSLELTKFLAGPLQCLKLRLVMLHCCTL
jgi:hypothetical protein